MITVRETTEKEKAQHHGMEYATKMQGDTRYYSQKAMEELHKKISETLNLHNVSGSSEIYCMYDRSDSEIFCAFNDKERADLEHEESGAPYQIVKLHHGKR